MLETIKQSRKESEADMSDESEQGEREQSQEQKPKLEDPLSEARQHALQSMTDTVIDLINEEQHIDWWGDPISEARQRALQGTLDTWNAPQADHGQRKGPFDDVYLSGADVFWLAEQIQDEQSKRKVGNEASAIGNVPHLHLEGAKLSTAQLKGAKLSTAHLEGANLSGAPLKEANLSGAHLEGADLRYAQLPGANLRGAWLDSKTLLGYAYLNRQTKLGDIHWSGVGNVDLTAIYWDNMSKLGDEQGVGFRSDADDHRAVVRAYRQVAAQLRAQGMAEEADRFAYRAQIRQRGVLLRTLKLPQYVFSWILYLLAGYGYQVWRTVFWYLVTIALFAFGYVQVTHGVPLFGLSEPHNTQPLQWYEALVLSLASFHGRGFFPQGINLGDPVAILAAGEAVVGLFVEISFIATFTQRYFANK